ncbi:FMN-binding protein [Clostridium sp.]|uniref:FMN-binding protein n=1 Tax=Clostridium sp. TaxID=1506 RepID=UPI002840FD40|nr:FMN-binding protein [Clostridium sp.]MDR3597202.1 FMN-binding protein [Clostridium sp.]
MVKKIKKSQVLRHIVQLILFILLPGIYSTTLSEVKTVYKMIIGGNFNFLQALPSLMEFVAVMLVTIIIGRWFCGWICAFGAYNDLIYFISKKIFKVKFRVNEQVDSILKYAKYAILLFIIIVSWTLGSNILESVSPWDAFGQITNFNISAVLSGLLIGLILLVLITIGAAFIERFFCRYLCPLGAIFAIISKFGITKINKPKADCGKCRACTMNCSMGLKLYKVDGAKGGDCINCLKCTEVCPRRNANINILGQDLNQSLAGSAAMAAMLGIYGVTNFGVDALTKAGVISNNGGILGNSTLQGATSGQYKDGTYTGSGQGFGGTTTVSVTIAGGKITDIKTISNQDTSDYYNRAFGIISKGIISVQTPNVDTVSGATYSSKGIISAVKDALSQAGGSSSEADNSSNTSADNNAAANSAENNGTTTGKYKDGTYTGSGKGFGGTTKVSVTIAGGKITDIKTISNQDTSEYYNRAFGTISKGIISAQTPNVDTVSGATYSSKGIISAVKDALSQTGGVSSNSDNSSGTSINNSAVKVSNSANINKAVAGTYSDGTYTGTGTGFGGAVTKMSVTISGGKISSIKALSNGDSPEFFQKASNIIISKMLSAQSAAIDTVSGATFSSNGIIGAVQNALNQAASSASNASQGSVSSSSTFNNSDSSQPTTPPPVANQKSSTPPTVETQKSTASNSTATQGGTTSKQNVSQSSTSSNTSTGTSNSSKGQYKDGTYTGSGSGFGGTTKISVTIANGKITSVSTISEEDTSRYYNKAIGPITNSVISKQTGSVDTVSGATHSSDGIIEAIQDALSQAK